MTETPPASALDKTFDPAAVNRMMDVVEADLRGVGATVTRFPGPPGLGDCLRGDFPHPRRGEPGILVMSHLDTVHPVGTLAKLPFRRDGSRWFPRRRTRSARRRRARGR